MTATTLVCPCTLLLAAENVAAPAVVKQQRPIHQLDLWEIAVDGNTVLTDSAIQEVLLPFLGLNKSPDDVDKAREALENLYHEQGFKTVSVTIPRQAVKDGTVMLQVLEGRVRKLSVVGSKYHSLTRIKEQAPAFSEGEVPDFTEVQQNLMVLNQQADQMVTPALKAGPTAGTIDVDLVVSDKLPLHGSLELNNRYSQGTSHLRAAGNIAYDNLWQRGHSASLFYQTAPENTSEAEVIVGSYTLRSANSPLTVTMTGMRSNSNVSTLGGIEVIGGGHSYGVRANWQLPATGNVSRSLSLGLDYKNFASKVNLGGASILTPIRYYPLSLGYSSFRRDDNSSLQLDSNLTVALPHMGSDSDTIDVNRFGARQQMIYGRLSLAYSHDLPRAFQLYGKTTAQLSDRPLISNEQLSAGGMDSVRGYLESEAVGDYGANGTLELRGPSLPDLLDKSTLVDHVQELRPFLFVDAASLHQHQPLPNSSRQIEMLSAGLGFNINLFTRINSVLDWSVPLVNGPTTKRGDDRLLFRLWTTF
jgi:hemolysin activation/secretion protein